MTISPFKFLDSYTKEDKVIFFGREREVEELYHRVFEGKIMLVYGVSGTGKSSLIHCGLANKFNEADWLPVNVRRAGDMVRSMAFAINQAAITPMEGEIATPVQFKKAVRSLYLDHYKPVFFIFDQFEELFIFGNKEEKKAFVQIVKALTESDLQCRFMFVLREEYLAGITEFEKVIPNILANRVRIERMTLANAKQVIEGPCKVFNIEVEDGFSDEMLEKLSPGSAEVELTYLQVYLDKVYRTASPVIAIPKSREKQSFEEKEIASQSTLAMTFTKEILKKLGEVKDLLGSFLDEQIELLPDPDSALAVLKSFVSVKATKRQMNPEEVQDYAQTLGKPVSETALQELLQTLIQLRILRDKDQNNRYELRHDALATKIYEKITLVEKELLEIRHLIENAYSSWEKRGVLMSAEDLAYITPYESRLYLSENFEAFIEASKKSLIRTRRRRRNMAFAGLIALVFVLSGFTFWAVKERQESKRNEIKFKASYFNSLANEAEENNPTIALRLSQYALYLDPSSKEITNNVYRIYYDNNFYKVHSNHKSKIISTALSLDGKFILVGYEGNSAELLDIDGKPVRVFAGKDWEFCTVAFSPDGNKVITGAFDGYVRVWDLQGNELRVIGGNQGRIMSVAISPDGNKILASYEDNTARLWDKEGNLLKELKGHKSPVFKAVFSPNGEKILTGSIDKTARLWNLQGDLLQVFTGHEGGVYSVAFSSDGQSILTGSEDNTARLWDLKGNLIKVFRGHGGNIFSVAFSPDGENILTGSFDYTVRLWDIKGNVIQIYKGHSDLVTGALFSVDGNQIYTSSFDKKVKIWDKFTSIIHEYVGHESAITSVGFSSDGSTLLSSAWDQSVRLWDNSGDLLLVLNGNNDDFHSAALSPDGQQILTTSADSTAILWNLQGEIIQIFRGHSDELNSVTFSPDGNQILTSGWDGKTILWDLEGNILLKLMKGAPALSSILSPDSKLILASLLDNTARLWDRQGNEIQIFDGHIGQILSICFSADGNYILTNSEDRTIRIWDLSGNVVKIIKGHPRPYTFAILSPDATRILVGLDNNAIILDWDGNTHQAFRGHNDFITDGRFSPDNLQILTGSNDKTVRLWKRKINYQEFVGIDPYENLSAKDKVLFGIIGFRDILNWSDRKEILNVAEYYYETSMLATFEESIKLLKNAEILFSRLNQKEKRVEYLIGMMKCNNSLQELIPSKKIKKKTEKLFNELITIDVKELSSIKNSAYLKSLADFFFSKTGAGYKQDKNEQYYTKAMQLFEKIMFEFPEEDVLDELFSTYNNLSLTLLYKGRIEESLLYAQKGLVLKQDYIIFTKLSLALLYNNRIDEAFKVITEYKDVFVLEMNFKEYILTKLEELKDEGVVLDDYDNIVKTIKEI